MSYLYLGGYEDTLWCTQTTFGSGIAKTLVCYINAHCGGDVSVELDYAVLSACLEFSETELRGAVAHLIAYDFARINHNRRPGGGVLELLTPGRRALEAKEAEAERRREAKRQAKIALRGGRVSRASIPDDVRLTVLERDGRACKNCGATKNLSLDHIYPWSLGGPDDPDNLQVLCRSCNSRKGARV